MPDNVLSGIIKLDGSGLTATVGEAKTKLADLQTQLKSATNAGDFNKLTTQVVDLKNKIQQAEAASKAFATSTFGVSRATRLAHADLEVTGRAVEGIASGNGRAIDSLSALVFTFERLKGATGSGQAAFKALGETLLSPAGIITGVAILLPLIEKLGEAIFGESEATKKSKEEHEKWKKAIEEAEAGAYKTIASLQAYINIVKDTKLPLQERNQALEEANKIIGEHGQKLTLVTAATADTTKEVNLLTEAFINQAVAAKYGDQIADQFIKQKNAAKEYGKALEEYNKQVKYAKENPSAVSTEVTIKAPTADITKLITATNNYKNATYELHQTLEDQGDATKTATEAFANLKKHLQDSGSIDGLNSKLKDLKANFDALSKSDRDGTVGKNFVKQIKDVETEIKKTKLEISIKPAKQKEPLKIETIAELSLNERDPLSEKSLAELNKRLKDQIERSFNGANTTAGIKATIPLEVIPGTSDETKFRTHITSLQSVIKTSADKLGVGFGDAFFQAFDKRIKTADAKGETAKQLSDLANKLSVQFSAEIAGAKGLSDAFGAMTQGVLDGKNAWQSFSDSVVQSLKKLAVQLVETAVLAAALSFITGGAGGAGAQAFGGGGQSFLGAFKKLLGFADGGFVPGSGNHDTIPAMLTPGEYVIPKDKVPAWLSIISAFGGAKGYSEGGYINAASSLFNSLSINRQIPTANISGMGGASNVHLTGQFEIQGSKLVAIVARETQLQKQKF